MATSTEPFSIRLPSEVKEHLEAEAQGLGRKPSRHAAAILEDHLAGRSIERVRHEMSDLSAEVSKLTAQLGTHTRVVSETLMVFLAQFDLSDDDKHKLAEKLRPRG